MQPQATQPDLSHIAEPLRPLAVPIDSLTLDPANARTHDEKNLDSIKGSFLRFGQRAPIVVQKQGLIVRAGNGRVMAARSLGWTHIAAVVVDESEVEATAFAIADNRTAELAEWDDAALVKLLESLPPDLLPSTGFSDEDLSELLTGLEEPAPEQDEVPEPPKDPVTKKGDLWLLGEHRLLCGDSTSEGDVSRLMQGKRADLVLTDPPYGVDYVGKTKDALTIQNDGRDGLEPLLRASLGQAIKVCRPGAVWYVAAPAGPQFGVFADILHELQVWRQTLTWVKDAMVLGHSDYHYKHEAIFYGWAPGASHRSPPDRTRTTVLEFERPKSRQPLGAGFAHASGAPSVRALTLYGGELMAAGQFTTAGGQPASCVAAWNGVSWRPLAEGISGAVSGSGPAVLSLSLYNGELIAGGYFAAAGTSPAGSIARWNGRSWSPLGSGIDQGTVFALTAYNNELVAGGVIGIAGGIVSANWARWTGCYANCDCSATEPVLNVADFICYLNRYAAGEPTANCDGSTVDPVLNVSDFTCFLNRCAAGCP